MTSFLSIVEETHLNQDTFCQIIQINWGKSKSFTALWRVLYMIYPRVRFQLWFINDWCTTFKSFLMVFSHRATVYLWSLHFLFSDVQKRTSNPAPCSAGVLFFPTRLLSLLPWHRRRKWLTLLTTVLTKTHIFKGRQISEQKQTGTFQSSCLYVAARRISKLSLL